MSEEKISEEHVLLKQIHFLTDLINNAKRQDGQPSTSGNRKHYQETSQQRPYCRNRHGKKMHIDSSQKQQFPHDSWQNKLPKSTENRKYTWNKSASIHNVPSKSEKDKITSKKEAHTHVPVVEVINNYENKKPLLQSTKGNNPFKLQKTTTSVLKISKDVDSKHVSEHESHDDIDAASSNYNKTSFTGLVPNNVISKSQEVSNKNPKIGCDQMKVVQKSKLLNQDGFTKSRSLSPEMLTRQTFKFHSKSKMPVLPSFVINKNLHNQVTSSSLTSTSLNLNTSKFSTTTKETLPSCQAVTTPTSHSKDQDEETKSLSVKPAFFVNKKGAVNENRDHQTRSPRDAKKGSDTALQSSALIDVIREDEISDGLRSFNTDANKNKTDIECTTISSRKQDIKTESPTKKPDIPKVGEAGTEREAVKSKLNTQLAEAAAKLEQLKRNLTNRKITMESLGSINMVKHRTKTVKSAKSQKLCHDSKLPGVRPVPVAVKTSNTFKTIEGKPNCQKSQQVIFDPKFSMNKKTLPMTSLPHDQLQLKVKTLQKGHNFNGASDPLCKTGQVIFDPKYKLRKGSNSRKLDHNSSYSFNRNTRLIVNTIKSKYKLIKTGTGSCQTPNKSSPYSVKNITSKHKSTPNSVKNISKHKLMKFSSPVASSSQSRYKFHRAVTKDLPNYKVHSTRYKLRKTLPHGASHTTSYLRSNFSDVPSLEAKHFQYTSQGQLIYTPQGIRKYHSFPSLGNKKHQKSAAHYRPGRYKLHHTGYQSFMTRYLHQQHYNDVRRKGKHIAKHRHMVRKTPTSRIRSTFIFLNGSLYKSSSKSLIRTSPIKTTSVSSNTGALSQSSSKVVTVKGVKFHMDASGNTLTRIAAGSTSTTGHLSNSPERGSLTYVRTGQGSNTRTGSIKTRVFASRAIIKSRATVMAKFRKDNTKQKYCLFYNRFGKCRKGDKCPYIHDPEKVAICTRFLRGTCQVKGCPFSHKLEKEKMPVCSYFLRGVCIRDDCPYLHVNVGKKASVCQDFLKGFCPLGAKCKKRHVRECPVFTQTGQCPDGEKCPLTHKIRIRKRKEPTRNNASSAPPATVTEDEKDDVTIPFKKRKLPAYISVSSTDQEACRQEPTIQESAGESIQIRPKLV